MFDTKKLRKDLADAEAQVTALRALLEVQVRACQRQGHKWGEIKYEPIEHKAYRIEGDPPGTMGIDWRGPMDVPAVTEKQWSRTCTECGFKETTQRTKTEYGVGRIPGTNGQIEVPDFNEDHWANKFQFRKDEY